TAVNDIPVLNTAITAQTANPDSNFSLNIVNNFSDIDAGDSLTYSATLADGTTLPSWLTFNTTTGTFTGKPTNADLGNLTIKVTAKDSSNTTVENSFQLTVNNTNTPPTAANKTLTVNEDNNYTFAVTDFGFSDVDTTDTLASIKITQLPTVGTLQLKGTAVTANQVITAVDIPSLVFTPFANANGSSYANFKFTVNDGIIDSVTANTITIDVTAVNDLPTGNISITGTPEQNQILTATNTLADADGLGTFNYQWQESADNGVTWTNISGATNNTFALSQTQVG
ncbi:putative Ig domain-containing protein, partial [Planktothrix tepida]